MNELMPFVVSGLTAGAIFGLCGTGLVIAYKTSGIFNFAHPALAAIGAYVFYYLHEDVVSPGPELGWPIAALITVIGGGLVMGVAMERVARALSSVSTSFQIVAMVGLQLGILGVLGLRYHDVGVLSYRPFLSTDVVAIFGTNVGYDQLILFGFSVGSVIGLYLFFRMTRLGMAMRAVVDNPELVDLNGTSPVSVRRLAWIISSVFASASGVLLGPVGGTVSALLLVALFTSSFGAAALGAFSSLPLTFAGGLAIGVFGDVSQKYIGDVSWLGGLRAGLPFLVLFVVLIVTPRAKLLRGAVTQPRPIRPSYQAPWKVRAVAGALVTGALALAPTLVGNYLAVWSTGLIYVILLLSLGLLVHMSGQVSLCQTTLAAIGAAGFAHAATDWGVPWLLAVLFGGLIAIPIGLLIAIPAIRVSGVFLALATLGFGSLVQAMFYGTSPMFTRRVEGLLAPRPSFARGDEAYYYVILAFAVLTAVAIAALQYSRLGRLLRALGDSPTALSTMGTTVNATRVFVFSISTFIAAISGALYASMFTAVTSSSALFQPGLSLQLYAVVMLTTIGAPWYALIGAITLQVIPTYLTTSGWVSNIGPYVSLIFGVSAVTAAVIAHRRPIMPQVLQRFCERFRAEGRDDAGREAIELHPPSHGGLHIDNLSVRFGGVTAVDGLSLHAPVGKITGLIGPNGAGKTTTFNATSGMQRPSGGSLSFANRDITRSDPASRARAGIGRTFQRVDLWETLSVRENVSLGCEAPFAGRRMRSQLLASRRERKAVSARTSDALRLADITHIADRCVGELSTSERRLVELARVLAGPFDLLLLDEPSSGLDVAETRRFGEILELITHERGLGILLVEHDMSLVLRICSYVYVMDFGRLIYEGTPDDLASSVIVRDAYLGSTDLIADLDVLATAAEAPEQVH